MATIRLYGRLRKEFGDKFKFHVRTAAEALRALNCAFPGRFVKAMEVGSYRLVRGKRSKGMDLDLELVHGLNLGDAELHIIPVATGSSNSSKGTIKTILGVVLVGAAIFMAPVSGLGLLGGMNSTAFSVLGMTYGQIAAIGVGLALAGVANLLSKPAQATETNQSYNIVGPSNTGAQGDAIPLIYGDVIAGSVGVSFDADVEDIGAYQGVDRASLYARAAQYGAV